MAEPKRSLSPDRALERLRQHHRHAVITLALRRAKKAVEARIRARGEKLAHYSARELRLLADAVSQRAS
jgi:hypothetical protein